MIKNRKRLSPAFNFFKNKLVYIFDNIGYIKCDIIALKLTYTALKLSS